MIELRTLGTLDLRRRDGPELSSILSQPKRTALFCYLALARPRGFHRRDTLLALFWPETDTEHARASLRQSIYVLRRSLGDGIVQSRGDEELSIVGDALWCDAVAFEAALAAGEPERALELYAGELLPGFFVDGAPEFEAWLESERERLRARAVGGAWALADACKRAGDSAAAGEWGRRAVALAPADDAALRRLMQLLERLGDPDGALAAYYAGARRLRVEFELEPSPETRDLAEEICERVRSAAAAARLAPPTAAPSADLTAASPAVPRPPPCSNGAPGSGMESEGATAAIGATVQAVSGVPIEDRSTAPSLASAARERRGWKAYVSRRAVLAALALAVIGAAGFAGRALVVQRRAPVPRPNRVVVVPFENRTGDPSLAPLGDMAADWVTQGLSEARVVEVVATQRVLALVQRAGPTAAASPRELVQRLARETGSRLVVGGSYYLDRDSVAFQAQVVDASTGRILRAVGPLSAARTAPAAGLQELRGRMLAELAVLLDERLPRWLPVSTRPPTYEAYREYMEGAHRIAAHDEYAEATENFGRAFELDTTFYQALVMQADAALVQGPWALYDSLAPRLDRLRDRLSPIQRHSLEYMRAMRAQNAQLIYTLAKRNVGGGPRTDVGTFLLGLAAGRTHRYRESLELLHGLERKPAFRHNWYWSYMAGAQHALGDFRGQMRSAARMSRQLPASPGGEALRLTALAARGRGPETRRLALDLAVRLVRDSAGRDDVRNNEVLGFAFLTPAVPFFLAARELAAHGHPAEARRVAEDGIRWCAARPPVERSDTAFQVTHALLLGMVGRWRAADSILSSTAGKGTRVRYAQGLTAAMLGDRTRALAIVRELDSTSRPPGTSSYEATLGILAALGQREEVFRRLRERLSAGGSFGAWWVHTDPALAPYLRDPGIQRLLRADG